MVVALCLVAVACSSSDDKDDDDGSSGTGAGAGAAGTSSGEGGAAGTAGNTPTAGTSGSGGTAGNMPMPIPCGSTECQPTGSFIRQACCVEATSTCGERFAFGGGACAEPVDPDPRCDSLMVMTFRVPSCCNMDNRCGIDTSGFGMPGCISLDELADIQGGDGGVADGGTGMGMNPFGGIVMLPAPRDCE
jgi:hypothetical protein